MPPKLRMEISDLNPTRDRLPIGIPDWVGINPAELFILRRHEHSFAIEGGRVPPKSTPKKLSIVNTRVDWITIGSQNRGQAVYFCAFRPLLPVPPKSRPEKLSIVNTWGGEMCVLRIPPHNQRLGK